MDNLSGAEYDCVEVRASLGTFLRQSSAFPKINGAKAERPLRLVLLPSLIAEIPGFSVVGQG
ncbi:MAG TPA: hypothetical protein VJ255_16230, partial [Candidatus Acidoferrum sp.]|nr:hypothetical protein [Candidatus Acidoferrum sp.]